MQTNKQINAEVEEGHRTQRRKNNMYIMSSISVWEIVRIWWETMPGGVLPRWRLFVRQSETKIEKVES